MRAEVLAIGDELTSGQRLDTNSQWLSLRLQELGIAVVRHATVADELSAMTEALRHAAARCEVAIVSGGLGPTADDLTRQALAEAGGVELELDEFSLRHIQQLFQDRGRPMPDRNRVQAMFPTGSRPIPNPHGTAPGIEISLPRDGGGVCHTFALPGVPAEMQEMWFASVVPALTELGGQRKVIRHRRLKCFGAGESQIESMLPDLIRRGRQPSVGITVHTATITLRITATGQSPQECQDLIAPTEATIRQCLGEMVFGEEDDELQHAVVRLLHQRGKTLATAEAGTAGRLGHWLSELAEAAGVYRGGLVAAAYANEDLVQNGRQLAHGGAEGCRLQFSADYGLAIGPIPQARDGGQQADEYFIALADGQEVTVHGATNAGHPEIIRDRAAKQALNLLRLHLLNTNGIRSAHIT
ncbi:MAG: CinA family nicotinamide mononucleotide deamidase-related protein [Planctomycetales bacterium]|nr:CinA family nicotinamide mononucleotide deamidase-related protein [Planctomycetales bacterium]